MNYSRREKFSIRKTTLGAVSVQLATLFATASLANVTVAADAVEPAATETVAETQEEAAVTQEDINQAQAELDTAQTALNQAQENLTKATQSEQEAIAEDKRLQELNELADQVTPQVVEDEKSKVSQLTETVEQDKAAQAEASQQVKQAETKVTTAKKDLNQSQVAVTTASTAVKTLTDDIKTLTSELDNHSKELEASQADAEAAKAVITSQSAAVSTATSTVSGLETKLAEATALEQDIKKVETDVQEIDSQITKLRTENPDLEILTVSYPLEFFNILTRNSKVLTPYPQGENFGVSSPSKGKEYDSLMSYDEYLTSLGVDDQTRADIYRMLEISESVTTTYVASEKDKNHIIAGPQLTDEELLELNTLAVKWLNQATKTYRETNGYGEYVVNPTMTELAKSHSERIIERTYNDANQSIYLGHDNQSLRQLGNEIKEATGDAYQRGSENASWNFSVNEMTDIEWDATTNTLIKTWTPVTMASLKESLIESLHRLMGDDSNPEFGHMNGFIQTLWLDKNTENIVALSVVLTTDAGTYLTDVSQGVGAGFYFNHITPVRRTTNQVIEHHKDNIKVGETGATANNNAEQLTTLTTTLNTLKQEQANLVTKQASVGTVATVQAQLSTAKQTLSEAKATVTAAEKSLKDAEEKVASLTKAVTLKQAMLKAKQEELSEKEKALQTSKEELTSKEKAYAAAQAELETAQAQMAQVDSKLSQSSQALQTAMDTYKLYSGLLGRQEEVAAELTLAQQALAAASAARQAAQEALIQALAVRDGKQAILTDLKSRYLAPILDNQGEPAPEKGQETVHLPVQLPVTGQQPETGQPVAGSGGFAAAGRIIQAVSANRPTTGQASPTYSRTARAAAEKALPNTGEAGSVLTLLGLGLTSLGLVGRKRRKA